MILQSFHTASEYYGRTKEQEIKSILLKACRPQISAGEHASAWELQNIELPTSSDPHPSHMKFAKQVFQRVTRMPFCARVTCWGGYAC